MVPKEETRQQLSLTEGYFMFSTFYGFMISVYTYTSVLGSCHGYCTNPTWYIIGKVSYKHLCNKSKNI